MTVAGADVTHVVALGITTDGTKVPLSLREGSTENATVATALLADLVDRGLRLSEEQLYVLDGAKALRKAVRDVAGSLVGLPETFDRKPGFGGE